MKSFRKAAVAAAVAVAVGVGGFTTLPATVQAFGLGDIGSVLGGGGSGKSVDINGLTGKKNSLLKNLSYSSTLLYVAVAEMNSAAGMGKDLESAEARKAAMTSALGSGDDASVLKMNEETMSPYADKNARKNTENAWKDYCKNVYNSGDEEKQKQLDSTLSRVKTERLASDGFVVAAAFDVVKIIKDAGSGIKSGGDMVNQFKEIMNTAKTAKTLLDQRSAISGMLKNATKEFEKSRKIESNKEAEKKAQDSIIPQ